MDNLLRKLVETEDKMERMSIVEELKTMVGEGVDNTQLESLTTEIENFKTQVEELTNQLEEQKQKYIDRFFEGTEEPKEEPKEEPEEETKTLTDILNGGA